MLWSGDIEAGAAVESLVDWWSLAGVTSAVSEVPVNWLQPVRPSPALGDGGAPATLVAVPGTTWPDTLAAFHDYLAIDTALPELSWPQMSGQSARVLPTGDAAPALMVIADIPDPEDMGSGQLLSGESGRLFDAMLNAIGLDRAKIYLASLAIARPTGNIIGEDDLSQLVSRMRHHISLVAPHRVLLLGDKTSRALLPPIDGRNNIGLRAVNHVGGTLDGLAISHPRFVLKQPSAKLECWRQLQLLIGAGPA